MPLREGGGGRKLTSIFIWFKSKWGVLPVKDGPWCWVQGIDISWVGVWNSQVRVEDNSTDRTFTLNQTIRIRLKSNFHFRFKSEPDKLKITRQFLCSLLKLWTLRQSHCKATIVSQQLVSSSPPMAAPQSHTKIENQPCWSGPKYTWLTFKVPCHGKISSSVSWKTSLTRFSLPHSLKTGPRLK